MAIMSAYSNGMLTCRHFRFINTFLHYERNLAISSRAFGHRGIGGLCRASYKAYI